MTLNFAETSPGVHMAQLEDSAKGTFRTIVIIESLGRFTLYVDGEIALRDLPTFEAAAAQADAILTKKGSRRMVQVAAALVLLSVIGGTAVGAVNLLTGSSSRVLASIGQSDPATNPRTDSAVASNAQGEQATTSIERSQSQVATVIINAPKSVPAGDVAPVSEQRSTPPVQNVIPAPVSSASDESQAAERSLSPASSATASTPTDTADQPPQDTDNTKAIETAKSDRRVFSATRPVFGGVRPPAAEGSSPVVTTAPPAAEEPGETSETADSGPVEQAPNPYASTAATPKPVATSAPTTEPVNEPTTELANEPTTEPVNEPTTEPVQVAERETQRVEGEGAEVAAIPLPNRNPLAGEINAAARNNAGQDRATVAIAPQQNAAPAAEEPPAAAKGDDPAARQQPIYPITAAPHRAEKQRAFGQRKKVRHRKKARKHRKARRHARRGRRVMHCTYGGCRWVRYGGYHDRQYRRHRHLYGRLTRY